MSGTSWLCLPAGAGVASCAFISNNSWEIEPSSGEEEFLQRMGEGRVNQNCKLGAPCVFVWERGARRGHGEHEKSLLQGGNCANADLTEAPVRALHASSPSPWAALMVSPPLCCYSHPAAPGMTWSCVMSLVPSLLFAKDVTTVQRPGGWMPLVVWLLCTPEPLGHYLLIQPHLGLKSCQDTNLSRNSWAHPSWNSTEHPRKKCWLKSKPNNFWHQLILQRCAWTPFNTCCIVHLAFRIRSCGAISWIALCAQHRAFV